VSVLPLLVAVRTQLLVVPAAQALAPPSSPGLPSPALPVSGPEESTSDPVSPEASLVAVASVVASAPDEPDDEPDDPDEPETPEDDPDDAPDDEPDDAVEPEEPEDPESVSEPDSVEAPPPPHATNRGRLSPITRSIDLRIFSPFYSPTREKYSVGWDAAPDSVSTAFFTIATRSPRACGHTSADLAYWRRSQCDLERLRHVPGARHGHRFSRQKTACRWVAPVILLVPHRLHVAPFRLHGSTPRARAG
jgi:hypothetical protein